MKGQPAEVKGFVLTGGLSRSKFFQEVLAVGIHLLEKDATVFISSHKGPLASQAATLGAMINAMVGSGLYKDLPTAIAELCPLKPLHEIGDKRLKALENLVRTYLL